jgi:DNA polymerase delta subunit 4
MSATLKQGKLDFASAKRTTSSSKIGKPNTPTASTTTLKPARKESSLTKSKSEALDDKSQDEIVAPSSDEDESEEFDAIEAISNKSDVETERKEEIEDAPTPPPLGRTTRASTKKTPSKKPTQAEVGSSTEAEKIGVFRVSNARPEDVAKKVEANTRKEDAGGILELNPKDPKWRKHYNEVKEKMGHMPASE